MSEPEAPLAAAFMGITLGVTADQQVEAWVLAARMHLLDDTESPDDALPVIGRDRRLPQYHLETSAAYRERLKAAWEIYEEGGTEEVIEKQILAAGWGPGVFIGEFGNPAVAFGDPQYY